MPLPAPALRSYPAVVNTMAGRGVMHMDELALRAVRGVQATTRDPA